ncbi:hypothetical protein PI125_g12474 [Phytophthora idaei]|nr:hypothetical protein PI125_g12474 [Phytophthora idaei]KAG3135247.1 hypothetical protein PI126_g18336 [Phytophthora idaei]
MWFNSKQSSDDDFELLKLDDLDRPFSLCPLLKTWVYYTDAIVAVNLNKASTLVSILETRFSDRPLLQILKAATQFPSVKDAATKLLTERVQSIFASRTPPKEVFKLLGLATMEDRVLSSPMFKKWMDYVKVFNKENPKKQEFWYDPLRLNHDVDWIIKSDKHSGNG